MKASLKKNGLFVLFKLIILIILEAVMLVLNYILKSVCGTVGLTELAGDGTVAVICCAFLFLLFLIYCGIRSYKYRVDADAREELGLFTIREGAVYAIFLMPLLITAIVTGISGIPSFLAFLYAPQMLFYTVTGSIAAGFGIPVVLYTSVVMAGRLASIARKKPGTAETAEKTSPEDPVTEDGTPQ